MFKECKYTSWYYSIITSAKLKPRVGQVERHHIIPRSLGGSNAAENLATLSTREHFICHLLLTKMVSGNDKYKMAWALHRMTFSSNGDRRIFSSHQYEMARRIFSEATRGVPKGTGAAISKALKGKPKSEAAKAALSKAMTGKVFSTNRNDKIRQAHLGRTRAPFTAEHRKAISEAARKRAKPSKERNSKVSAALTGKPKSIEHRQKISEALRLAKKKPAVLADT